MAIKIKFDKQYNPEPPSFILSTRSGKKYNGILNAENIIVSDRLNDKSEVTFKVRKYSNGKKDPFWNSLENFKLLWCREWNMFLEATVNIDESDETIKTVYGTQLGIAELSKLNLHNIEINTETDISRADYDVDYPTVFYRYGEHKEASLLDRLLADKAPHYKIRYVSDSLANEKRTFSFDDISIYDAFLEISEELDCLFIFHSGMNENHAPEREISVVDLLSYCPECGHRGEFSGECPECKSKNIFPGYGVDTTIFVTSDELADNIQYTTDTDSVKNCMKLKAGDDVMTAAIRSCNPNGSDYIWHFDENTKKDMSDELQEKLEEYDDEYIEYRDEHPTYLDTATEYNELVDKYYDKYNVVVCSSCGYKTAAITPGEQCPNPDCLSTKTEYSKELTRIPNPTDGSGQNAVIGYTELMNVYYNTIDFSLFLESEMMPRIESQEDSIDAQIQIINNSLTVVSVKNVDTASISTVESAVLGMAKVLMDTTRYTIEITGCEFIDSETVIENNIIIQRVWDGTFKIIDNSDKEQTLSFTKRVAINGDYENFCKQKVEKTLAKANTKDMSISGLFEMEGASFSKELKKYCKNRLTSFNDSCTTCLEVLVELGVAEDSEADIYDLYRNYLSKQSVINDELNIRESEIETIKNTQDEISKNIEEIRSYLSIDNYLGETLWHELCAYRRDDTYSNENYISDGYDNKELFAAAKEFIKEAEKELFKSAELQHSISSSLKNLLVIDKFEPLVQHFEVGNWIRVKIDDSVYKLRLISYEIDYDNISHISVEFSDVTKTMSGISDIQSILSQATSIASSYDSYKKQAKKGEDGKNVLDNWVYNGLYLTNMKIVGNADNQDIVWDSHGLLLREKLIDTDGFDPRQAKFINKGIYLTDDNWQTSRAAIGNFTFYNPITKQVEETYGVIADTLVGHLVLSEEVWVCNSDGNVVINNNGINVIADGISNNNVMSIGIQQKYINADGDEDIRDIFYVNSAGDLVLTGSIRVQSSNGEISNMNDLCNDNRLMKKVDGNIANSQKYILGQLDNYKAEIGQYMIFTGEGLKIGANQNGLESAFSTVIDNRRMSFKQNSETIAYIGGQRLFIQNATIKNTLSVGNYSFIPKNDKSVVVLWEEIVEYTPVTIVSSPLETMSVYAGEPVTFEVSVAGDVESITWDWSTQNGKEGTWTVVETDKLSCVIEMPSETISKESERIQVRCIVIGKDGSSADCVTTITEIKMADDENNYIEKFSISYNLSHYTSSVSSTSIFSGETYETILIPDSGYKLKDYSMTMNERDVSSYFNTSTNKFSVVVTGDIVINVSGTPISGGLITKDLLEEISIDRGDGIVELQIAASGDELTYDWYYSNDNVTWNECSTDTTQTDSDVDSVLRIDISSYMWTTRYYKCVVADLTGNSEVTKICKIVVVDKLKIIQQPVDVTVNEGETARFNIVATGTNLTYKWYQRKSSVDSFIPVPFGGTNSTFSTYASSGYNGMQFKCVVTDNFGISVESNVVILTVI